MKYGISIIALGTCLVLTACGPNAKEDKSVTNNAPDLCIQNAIIYSANGNVQADVLTVNDGIINSILNT